MASIAGIKLTAIKSWLGEEGYTYQGNLYMDGTKIGFWSQDSHGGPDDFQFSQKQYEKMFFDRVKEYYTKNPPIDEFKIFGLTDEELDMDNLPRITVNNNDDNIGINEDSFMYELVKLSNDEKEWKKQVKKGYSALCIVDYYHTKGPVPRAEVWHVSGDYKKHAEEILTEAKKKKASAYITVYATAEDFILV